MSDNSPTSQIVSLLPSAHWRTAVVIVLACGHRHVRPAPWPVQVGEAFPCCFCADQVDDVAP